MSDEPKENKCEIEFICCGNDCAYKVDGTGRQCERAGYNPIAGFLCNSVVAQTNKMVLLLQDAGFDVTMKGKGDNE